MSQHLKTCFLLWFSFLWWSKHWFFNFAWIIKLDGEFTSVNIFLHKKFLLVCCCWYFIFVLFVCDLFWCFYLFDFPLFVVGSFLLVSFLLLCFQNIVWDVFGKILSKKECEQWNHSITWPQNSLFRYIIMILCLFSSWSGSLLGDQNHICMMSLSSFAFYSEILFVRNQKNKKKK